MNRFFRYKLDHAIFWVATVLFYVFTRTHLVAIIGFWQFLLDVIIRNGLLAIVIYFHLYYLLPRLLKRGKLAYYVVGLVLAIAFYLFAKNWQDVSLQTHGMASKKGGSYLGNIYYNFSILCFYFLFSLALVLSKEWYLQKEQLRQAQLEKLNAELAYLRAQTNPHFIFNTINTIYFQIDKKNGTARETLMLFSNILRYQLYDCNEDLIAIEKEITSLKSYVTLQKMRKDGRYMVEFICQPSVKEFSIAPLLLMPFIENAFKHISSFSEQENKVTIEMDKVGNVFYFNVFNTQDLVDNKMDKEVGGIGLKNVRRRLQLLYHDKHELLISNDSDAFSIYLTLEV